MGEDLSLFNDETGHATTDLRMEGRRRRRRGLRRRRRIRYVDDSTPSLPGSARRHPLQIAACRRRTLRRRQRAPRRRRRGGAARLSPQRRLPSATLEADDDFEATEGTSLDGSEEMAAQTSFVVAEVG